MDHFFIVIFALLVSVCLISTLSLLVEGLTLIKNASKETRHFVYIVFCIFVAVLLIIEIGYFNSQEVFHFFHVA